MATSPISISHDTLSFSPPLPARSPLRPPARSISSQSDDTAILRQSSNISTLTLDSPITPQTPTDDLPAISDLSLHPKLHMRDRHNSFPSLSGLIDPLDPSDPDILQQKSPERSQTPLSINLEDELLATTSSIDDSSPSISNSTSSASSVAPSVSHSQTLTTMSKRHHAMHELLSSERAYASDLVLISEAHIPLALGLPVPLQNVSILSSYHSNGNINSSSTPSFTTGSLTLTGSNSDPSSRTVSFSSDLSSPDLSNSSTLIPPVAQCMTQEDVKIIFSNIEELAVLSNAFSEKLEQALGTVVDGGQGEDYIGALFLQVIPQLERPYKQYITRHPTALQHLQNLPQTPALTAYLSYTQRVAAEYSHAWDLASLLIKPVQRLLKYPLLLNAIIDETPDGHPDKENLRIARERIEELARNVNEGRRRAEVVKDVLTAKTLKKPNAPVGVSAGVNLSKVKSLRHGGVTAALQGMKVSQLTEGGNGEAAQVEAMQSELKKIEVFAQQFARNVVDWGKMMANVMLALRTWALSFGKVIGLSADQGSEAFDAFMNVIKIRLMPLTADLEAAINERLLKDMAHLLMTMNQPLKLLASMNEQEPYHYHLLTMPVSAKNRPPPALLAASTNYLALRGQLAAELPIYLRLLHKGFVTFVLRLSAIQTRFWKDVKEHWAELWDMLRVESELNVGWEETCHVWHGRWADVDEVVRALGIMMPVPHVQPTPRVWHSTPVTQMQMPPPGAAAGPGAGAVPTTPTAAVPIPIPVPAASAPIPIPVQSPTPNAVAAALANAIAGGGLSGGGGERGGGSSSKQQQPFQFEEYFAYPGFYMPMTPHYATSPSQKDKEREKERERERQERQREKKEKEREAKEQKEREREAREREKREMKEMKEMSSTKLEKLNTKISSGSNNYNNANNNANNGVAKVATVHSMFAALEPSHSALHKYPSRQTLVPTATQRSSNSGGNGAMGASTSSLATAYSPVFVVGSPSSGSSSQGNVMYAVSGPMALGSVPVQARGLSRGRGPSRGSGSGSGSSKSRRPSSQDSVQPRVLMGDGSRSGGGVGQRGQGGNGAGGSGANLTRRRTHGHGMAEEYAEYIATYAVPPPYEWRQYPYNGSRHGHGQGGLARMKSMPLSKDGESSSGNNNNNNAAMNRMSFSTTATSRTAVSSGVFNLTNGGGYVVDGDHVYYQEPLDETWDLDDELLGGGDGQQQQYVVDQEVMLRPQAGDERGRVRTRAFGSGGLGGGGGGNTSRNSGHSQGPPTPSAKSGGSSGSSGGSSNKTKEHARKRSGSVKSITSFFSGTYYTSSNSNSNSNNNYSPPPDPQPLTASQRDSWVSKPAKYVCQVIHPCKPPASVSYYSFPFFTLRENELYEVLQEAGHPSIHPKLPLYVDDGEDCLLLCRDGNGVVGWALASFLEPLSISG